MSCQSHLVGQTCPLCVFAQVILFQKSLGELLHWSSNPVREIEAPTPGLISIPFCYRWVVYSSIYEDTYDFSKIEPSPNQKHNLSNKSTFCTHFRAEAIMIKCEMWKLSKTAQKTSKAIKIIGPRLSHLTANKGFDSQRKLFWYSCRFVFQKLYNFINHNTPIFIF